MSTVFLPLKLRSSYGYGFGMDMQAILGRIQQRLDALGIKERSASTLSGSPDLIRNWRRRLKNGEDPGANADSLRRVAQTLKVSYTWLTTGSEFERPERVETYETVPNGYLSLEVFDTPVAAGPDGGMPGEYEEATYKLAFPPDYIKQVAPDTPVHHLQILPVHGRSMEPTLNNNDIVMVDTSRRNPSWDGMFVIRIGGALHVKRISRAANPDYVRIVSDNSDKETYPTVEQPAVDVDVVGRVRWYGAKA